MVWKIKSCGERFKVIWESFIPTVVRWSQGGLLKKTRGGSLGFSVPLDKNKFFRSCLPGQQEQRLVLRKSYPFFVRNIPSLCVLTLPTAPTVCFATHTDCVEENSSLTIWVSPRTQKNKSDPKGKKKETEIVLLVTTQFKRIIS